MNTLGLSLLTTLWLAFLAPLPAVDPIVGSWSVVGVDDVLAGIDSVPPKAETWDGKPFGSLDEYKDWLRRQLSGREYVFTQDHRVDIRFSGKAAIRGYGWEPWRAGYFVCPANSLYPNGGTENCNIVIEKDGTGKLLYRVYQGYGHERAVVTVPLQRKQEEPVAH